MGREIGGGRERERGREKRETMATVASATIKAPSLLLIRPSKSLPFSIPKPYSQPLTFPSVPLLRLTHEKLPQKTPQIWRISAAVAEDSLPPPPIETTQQMVPAAATESDSVSTIVSSLLLVAFVGLSLLTIGVNQTTSLILQKIYIFFIGLG